MGERYETDPRGRNGVLPDVPEANTQYRDTVYMNESCYTFEFFDSDDDVSFWANDDGVASCASGR